MQRGGIAWRLSPQLYAWRMRQAKSPHDSIVPQFIADGLEDAANAGYDGVELGLSAFASAEVAEAVSNALKQHKLGIAALFYDVSTGADDESLRKIGSAATQAAKFGARLLNIITVADPATQAPHKKWRDDGSLDSVLRVMSVLAEEAERGGMNVCWHPHAENLSEDCTGLRRFLQQSAQTRVGVCLDLGWVLRAGSDPLRALRLCGDRLSLIHLRDFNQGVWCQALGEGLLDLEAIGQYLVEYEREVWTSVEFFIDRSSRVTRSLADNARASASELRSFRPWKLGRRDAERLATHAEREAARQAGHEEL
ncbi:MAG: sugar phosphate isomerase/epimerase [Acidobacteria bacterium]|nr:sugar phosphate isomerase/epimerase [Acidobacteriota bacterium]